MLSKGDIAPNFTGTDQNGRTWTLDTLLQNGAVVLYFYPKDFTPVCTKQACVFRDAHEELARSGVQVVGVSGDDTDSHDKFAKEHRIPFPLLADPDKAIRNAYEAKQLLGLLPKRVTYVIGPDKRIRGVFHNELNAQKHLDAVREMIKP